MRLCEINGTDIFDTSETSRPKYNDMLHNPGKYPSVSTEIKYMSPFSAMSLMAKGQGKSLKHVIDRRMNIAGKRKIDQIVSDMKSGIKYHVPTLDYDNGGFVQDGYHRLMAARRLNKDIVPVLVIRR